MTKDDIVDMAKPYEWLGAEGWTFNTYEQLEAFAKLVAEREREQCAALVESNADACVTHGVAQMCLYSNASAIRRRNEK